LVASVFHARFWLIFTTLFAVGGAHMPSYKVMTISFAEHPHRRSCRCSPSTGNFFRVLRRCRRTAEAARSTAALQVLHRRRRNVALTIAAVFTPCSFAEPAFLAPLMTMMSFTPDAGITDPAGRSGLRLRLQRGIAMAVLAMLPPVVIVVIFQSWFIKGLTESDK
jgi:hypothetical protein